MGVITLTTDFGLQDWFVGTMKGVILGISARMQVVDITHGISSGDVRGGAFALAASYRYFPRGTIHVAVVDPGVGSKRGAIAVKTKDYIFIAPDNGVLSFALRGEKVQSMRRIENTQLFLKPVSRTFHGRDVFAPVAAHLGKGGSFARVGPAVKEFVRLEWPECNASARGVEGEVIYIDRFGNAITALPNDSLRAGAMIRVKGKTIPGGEFYESVPDGSAVAVAGSSGFVEIAVNGGSAAGELKLRVGDRVVLCAKEQGDGLL